MNFQFKQFDLQNINIQFNRQKVMTYAAIAGGILLLFYWTHLGFNSAISNTESNIRATEQKIEKAIILSTHARKSGGGSAVMNTGLLSFLQTSADKAGLADRVGGIRPKTVPGAVEAASIRLESLKYNELISFLRSVERYGNLTSSNIKISKRYDNNRLLNLMMDIVKTN
ncbi:hypothetical protein Dacet_0481 [Denitrovibrio acetiphilus DSM 12809]|uniref:Uncharacterized protein n=1 Tax=Denitrovibrio acetiphilus (strain DSM 12809 / NBRC 114555 / N2460) TaxID=522772 RepID=D4H3W8_DENA2|nr:hypothetical protein [Denitrovibrio acetiphilus]ADD67279.1 hypothetical protein Dacet_0481 [Denitrovibrio acetiphilus DSM 12809]